MANHESAKKSIRKIKERTKINRMRMSQVRTSVKKLELAIVENRVAEVKDLFINAQSLLMSGVSKGILKLNTASRKVQRLAARVKALG